MDDINNKGKKTNRILTIVIVILIIIIILLLLKGCSKKDDNISHKGKINVFEIKCDTNCNCECEKDDNNNTDNDTTDKDKNKDSNDKTKEVIKEVDDNPQDNTTEVDIKVLDNDKTWQGETNINIFSDSTYVVKGKIAPESSGIYQFAIKNSTSFNVKYNIDFNETNDYNINIKYKLKKNNDYVISDWVTYSSLKQKAIRLNSKSSDTYYLEWKWFEGSNDNSIGSNPSSKYGLSIDISAVQVND